MEVVTAICLVYMVSLIIAFGISIFKDGKRAILRRLKSFKKGKAALIYLAAVPLYILAHNYNGSNLGISILQAIKSCVDLVVLKYDYSSIAALTSNSQFYRFTIDVCFILVTINAIIFAASLFGQSVYNWFYVRLTAKHSKKIFVIVGKTQSDFSIIKSINKHDKCIVLADITREEQDEITVLGKGYIRYLYKADLSVRLERLFGNYSKKKVNVIINSESQALNLLLAGQMCDYITSNNLHMSVADEQSGLNVYVCGQSKHDAAFIHFVEKTNGRIKFINRDKLIAMDFIGRYPITQYMTSDHIDFSSGTIKSDIDLNVALVGFGKANSEIFLSSVSNNQFFTKDGNGEVVYKPVNYFVYDKKDPSEHEKLNNSYFRYFRPEYWKKDEEYLPMPLGPAVTRFEKFDIQSARFYHSLFENMCKNKNSFNYIIVACGDDMLNLSTGQILAQKFKEWGALDYTKIFVKICNEELNTQAQKEYSEQVIPFGSEEQVIFNVQGIVNEKIEEMAMASHITYMKDDYSDKSENEIMQIAIQKWYGYTQAQRDANIYACLALRTKLQLIGYDYIEKQSAQTDSSEEFKKVYNNTDEIGSGETLRDYFAIQEHQRWNANMICNGIVPSSVNEIKTDSKGKRMDLRRHGNLTDFQGLIRFKEIVSDAYGISQDEANVIRYDYRLMDNAHWLLDKSGFKIIKKQNISSAVAEDK